MFSSAVIPFEVSKKRSLLRKIVGDVQQTTVSMTPEVTWLQALPRRTTCPQRGAWSIRRTRVHTLCHRLRTSKKTSLRIWNEGLTNIVFNLTCKQRSDGSIRSNNNSRLQYNAGLENPGTVFSNLVLQEFGHVHEQTESSLSGEKAVGVGGQGLGRGTTDDVVHDECFTHYQVTRRNNIFCSLEERFWFEI